MERITPILYIDVNGDSISVAQEHRESFMNDITNVSSKIQTL